MQAKPWLCKAIFEAKLALSAFRTLERFIGVLQPDDVKDVLADSVLLMIASTQARSKSFSSGRKGP